MHSDDDELQVFTLYIAQKIDGVDGNGACDLLGLAPFGTYAHLFKLGHDYFIDEAILNNVEHTLYFITLNTYCKLKTFVPYSETLQHPKRGKKNKRKTRGHNYEQS